MVATIFEYLDFLIDRVLNKGHYQIIWRKFCSSKIPDTRLIFNRNLQRRFFSFRAKVESFSSNAVHRNWLLSKMKMLLAYRNGAPHAPV